MPVNTSGNDGDRGGGVCVYAHGVDLVGAQTASHDFVIYFSFW